MVTRCQIRGPAQIRNNTGISYSASCWSIGEQLLGTKGFLFCETFKLANLLLVRFGSDRRAFGVHLRQYLLGIRGYLQFDAPPPAQRFLGRKAPASSAQGSDDDRRDERH